MYIIQNNQKATNSKNTSFLNFYKRLKPAQYGLWQVFNSLKIKSIKYFLISEFLITTRYKISQFDFDKVTPISGP